MPQDDNQITHQFWQDVRYNIARYRNQQDPGRNPMPSRPDYNYNRKNQKRQHKGRNHIKRKLQYLNGYPKAFVGSGGSNNPNNKFIQFPLNSLNVMDYVRYKGYRFLLTSRRNGADYALGIDSRTMKSQHRQPNANDLSSVHVALHPQYYYKDDGSIAKDKDGKPVFVTGRGAFTRFSEGYSSSKKNPILSMMQDVEGVSFGQALKEFKQMTQDYGVNTKFDPLDRTMKLPRTLHGEAVDPNRNPRMDSSSGHNEQTQNNYDMDNEYQKVAKLGHHLLTNTQIGEKPLQRLHELGYTDQTIDDKNMGWFPKDNLLSKASKEELHHDLGIPIKSQLYIMDENFELSDRFNGQYTAPMAKGNRYVGIQGFDHDMQPTQKARYSGKYAYNALGSTMNGINKGYKDHGGRFNRTDKAGYDFAQGYLHGKRAISERTVNRLMDTGMVRVGLGKNGDPRAHQEAEKLAKDYRYLEKNGKEYAQAAGNQAYEKIQKKYPNAAPEPHPDQVKERLGNEALDKKKRKILVDHRHKDYQGKSFPPYIEFPQYLDGNDQNGISKGKNAPVGADRIYFKNGSDYERNTDYGKDGKQVVKDSMHNYGYNINCGKKNSPTGKRELYVFESPVDAISYIDLHREQLAKNPNSCDVLSLSGSNAKTRTISNFIYNKIGATDDHYDKIHFGTDNDVHGQETITEYTEKARNHWRKDRVNHLFHGIVPPQVADDTKDWNDVAKYQSAHPKENALQDAKSYSMDEIKDKAVANNLGHLSDKGVQHVDRMIKSSKRLYLDYVNQGESSNMDMHEGTIGNMNQEFGDMQRDSYRDAKIYHDFNRSIGESFNPYELDESFQKNVVAPHQERTEEPGMAYDSSHNPIIESQKASQSKKVVTNKKSPDESNPKNPEKADSSRTPEHSDSKPSSSDASSRPSAGQDKSHPTDDAVSKQRTTVPDDKASKRPTPEEEAMPDSMFDSSNKKHHKDTMSSFKKRYYAQEIQFKKQRERQRQDRQRTNATEDDSPNKTPVEKNRRQQAQKNHEAQEHKRQNQMHG